MPQTSLYKDHFRLHRLVGNTVIIGLLASLAAFMFFLHKLDIQLFLQSSATVSYTHLDVYKRQVYLCANVWFHFQNFFFCQNL